MRAIGTGTSHGRGHRAIFRDRSGRQPADCGHRSRNAAHYCTRIAQALHGGNFRAYTSDDIVGAELGGAVKNVLAIATGISDGMGFGNNARAALITRGLAEMMRLGRVLGAQEQTLTGLAGMGDLVLTSTGDLSRNRRLGLALGAGKSVEEAIAEIGQVVEGSVLPKRSGVWPGATRGMPISEQVNGIIHQGWDPSRSVRVAALPANKNQKTI